MIPAQLSLLDGPPPTRAEAMTRKERWLVALRALVRLHYKGQTITADEVHRLIDHAPELRVPDGMSPNVMGTFFATWSNAEPTGQWIRSTREGSHGNLLQAWRIW